MALDAYPDQKGRTRPSDVDQICVRVGTNRGGRARSRNIADAVGVTRSGMASGNDAHSPQSVAALDDLIAALTEIRDGYVLQADRWVDELEQAEAARYIGQLLSAMSELYWEADPSSPRFVSIVDPGRKLQGDNPDAIYHFARIDGGRSYRISGCRDLETYTSFTLHAAADDGGMAGPLRGDVNDSDLQVESDGSYTLTLSADEAAAEGGNWLALESDVIAVIVRGYFQLETSAQNDSAVHVDIDIACLDADGPPAPLSDEAMAARMREGIAFLRQTTTGQAVFSTNDASPVPFVSDVVNELPVPFSFRDSGMPVPGAADIHYSMCRFELEPQQALVMRGTLPPGPFANVMLWNAHMQTLDYRGRQSSLNAAQIQTEADGSFEIWVADRDPGKANWLDTGGHARGSIFWRYLLPESDPGLVSTEVVDLG